MLEEVEIKGGAGEFEAAVIAVVLEQIAEEERAVRGRHPTATNGLPAWIRAIRRNHPDLPQETVRPDGF